MGEDIETFAARRAPRTRRRSHYALLALPLAILALIALNAALIGWRADVVRVAPQTASLYAAIGLPDLRGAFGLTFDEGTWLGTIAMAPQLLVAPAIPWLATAFGVRRVLIGPSLIYIILSLAIPFVRDYQALLILHFIHGLLLGVFIPATIMIVLHNLPMRWWIVGLAIGVIVALASSRFVATLVFGVAPTDPLSVTAATVVLLAVAALAGYLPARHAARVNPLIALRAE